MAVAGAEAAAPLAHAPGEHAALKTVYRDPESAQPRVTYSDRSGGASLAGDELGIRLMCSVQVPGMRCTFACNVYWAATRACRCVLLFVLLHCGRRFTLS